MPVESLINFKGGLVNGEAPYQLKSYEATVADNVDLEQGTVAPLAGTLAVGTVTGTKSLVKFSGAFLGHTAERWYVQSDVSGTPRLYWADGGTNAKKRKPDGTTVNLGVEYPVSTSTPGGLWQSTWPQKEVFTETTVTYALTYYSDPLLGGWGGESAPTTLTSFSTDLGVISKPFSTGTVGQVAIDGGTYNAPPGGSSGYLATAALGGEGGHLKIGNTIYRWQDLGGCFPTGSATEYWSASTNYSTKDPGYAIVPLTPNGYWYELVWWGAPGTSGATEPAWTTGIGDFITDGGVQWVCRGPATYAWSLIGVRDERNVSIPAYGSPGAPDKGTDVRIVYMGASFNLPTPTDPQVTTIRIYRKFAGEFLLVDEKTSGSFGASFSDYKADADLAGSDILTSDGNWPPPANLTGLAGPYNGMFVGWKDNNLYFSKTGLPDAWPDQSLDFPTKVKTCVVMGGFLVVLCEDGPWTVTGNDYDSLSRFQSMSTYGCLSGRSACLTERGLVYQSNNGIILFDGVRGVPISHPKLDTPFVTGLLNTRGAFFKGFYYLFHSLGVLACDMRRGELVWRTASVTCDSLVEVPADDALYLAKPDGSVVKWAAGSPLGWTYTTGEISLGTTAQWKLIHTITLDYHGDVRVIVTVDGKTYKDKTLTGGRKIARMRLPGTCRGYLPQITFQGLSGTATLPDGTTRTLTPGSVYGIDLEFSGPERARP